MLTESLLSVEAQRVGLDRLLPLPQLLEQLLLILVVFSLSGVILGLNN